MIGRIVLGAALIAVGTAAGPAAAQDAQEPLGLGALPGLRCAPDWAGAGDLAFSAPSDPTEAQMTTLTAIANSHRRKDYPQQLRIILAPESLQSAISGFDKADIYARAEHLGEVEGDVAVESAKIYAEAQKVLPSMAAPAGRACDAPDWRSLPLIASPGGLNADQASQVEKVATSHLDEWKALDKKAEAAEQALNAALARLPINEGTIRRRATDMAKVDGEIALASAQAYREVRLLLTVDQLLTLERQTSDRRVSR